MSGATIAEIDAIFASIRAMALDSLESVENEQVIFKAIQLNTTNITKEDLVFLFEKSSIPGFEVVDKAFQRNNAYSFIPIIQEIARYYLLQVKDRERFFITILTQTELNPSASYEDKIKALDELRDILYIVFLQAQDVRRCFLYALNAIINNKTSDEEIKAQLIFPTIFANYQFMYSMMDLMTNITKVKPLNNTQEFISDYELIRKLFELLTPYISPVQQQLEKLYDSKIELRFKQAAGLSPTSHDKLVTTNVNCLAALLLQFIATIRLELTPSLQSQNPALHKKFISIFNDAQALGNDINSEIARLFKSKIKANFKEHRSLKLRLNDLYIRFNQARQQEHINSRASNPNLSQLKTKPASTSLNLKATTKHNLSSEPMTTATELELRRRKEEESERRIVENRKEAELLAELQREETKRLAELKIEEQRLKQIREREKELEIAKQNEIARAAKASSKEERAMERPAEFIELIKPQTEPSITVLERLNKMVGSGRHRILDKISKLYEDTKLDRKYTFEELATISEALDGIVVGRPPHVCIQFDITTAEDRQPKKAIVRLNTHTRTDAGGTLLGCYVNHFRDVLQRQSTDQKPGLGITKVILDAFIANHDNKLGKSFKA